MLSGLRPFTEYRVKVAGATSKGFGPFTDAFVMAITPGRGLFCVCRVCHWIANSHVLYSLHTKSMSLISLSLSSSPPLALSPGLFEESEKRAWYPLFAHVLS